MGNFSAYVEPNLGPTLFDEERFRLGYCQDKHTWCTYPSAWYLIDGCGMWVRRPNLLLLYVVMGQPVWLWAMTTCDGPHFLRCNYIDTEMI